MQLQGCTSTGAATAAGPTIDCCWVGLPGDQLPASTELALRAGERTRFTPVREHLGVEIPAKHAMYRRAPYPTGNNRAATLMMNIISEARGAAHYRRLAAESREPVLQRIWQLLGRDEARHARAFYVFCKELCERNEKNTVAALEMACVWLADRSGGIKHPAGQLYPHSTSARGVRRSDGVHQGMVEDADESVLSMIRRIAGDPSLRTVRDLKAQLRARA